MIINQRRTTVGLTVATALAIMLLFAAGATARTQLNLISHFGGEVNQNGANVCLVSEACQPGSLGGQAGWFQYPSSVAVDQTTHGIYVADNVNSRVEELGPNGEFILMWGWKVNQNGTNVCAKAEASKCQAGEQGTGLAEQMYGLYSIAVDQTTHDVYVLDLFYNRIDEFEPDGKFALMFGGEVNENGTNVCLAAEASKCRAGKAGAAAGFFESPQGFGSLLAVGGPSHLVYVADRGRVQEFNASGQREGQLSLSSPPFYAGGIVTGLAVDGAGDVYVTESHGMYSNGSNPSEVSPPGVHEFNLGGTQIAEFDMLSSRIEDVTLDPSDRLTVIDDEPSPIHGVLYSLSGAPVSRFGEGIVSSSSGLAYDDTSGDLYAVRSFGGHEVNVFAPVITPEAITGGTGGVQATSATLEGEANAEESPPELPPSLPAMSFFEYGRCGAGPAPSTCIGHAYDRVTTTTPDEETGLNVVSVSAHVESLYPNQLYHYRLAARDKNGTSEGEPMEFTTRPLPPAIEAVPQAPFVRSESAVLSGSLNPENAATKYHFQYGACEPVATCASTTPDAESSAYEQVGLTQEVIGLLPSTTYRYRLVARNEHNETSAGPEATLTTGPPVTVAATTGLPTAITATSAVVSGTVNPDGQPATYVFELGAYEGARTHFGIVTSGAVSAEFVPVEESLALSGLQPGTAYAYRIAISSGYGEATGAVATFTTAGLASVLSVPTPLGMLTVPTISFPASSSAGPHALSCKHGYTRDKQGRCVKAKKRTKSRARRRKARKASGHGRHRHAMKTFKGGK
jgi:NHL repeat